MATLFPKWMNRLPTIGAVGAVCGTTAIVCGFWYYATPKFWRVGYEPIQPGGGFNHQLHAGELGLDCRYCHTKIEKSAEANVPNVATCYGCHREGALRLLQDPQTPRHDVHVQRTAFVREAYAAGTSIPWTRVHKLPDYVRNFPHDVHLAAGVSCFSCHGRIDQMAVVYHSQPLSMSWCLDCHRAPEMAVLEDKTRITDLQYVETELAKRQAAGFDEAKKVYERTMARERLPLTGPENCGACHH